MAGLNLLAAIVIYWSTVLLGETVRHRKRAGLPVKPNLLAYISPLGWAHILLIGEYRLPKTFMSGRGHLPQSMKLESG